MLFLVAVGAGAAVLEVHRALQHNANGDVKALQEREATLRKQLQDIQRDLRSAQQQRELTEAEAAQLAAVNTRLSAENQTLAASAASLTAENAELSARAAALAQQTAALESSTEALRLENGALTAQFDRLRLRYEEEAAGFSEQLGELKAAVGGALSRFTSGEISADQLVAFLSAMGVELRGRKEDLASLPEQLNSARSTEERLKLLDRVEVEVGEGWLQQMRLVAAEPQRAARLLAAGQAAARESAAAGSGASTSGPALLDAPEAAAAAAAAAAASSSAPAQLVAKLPTPPKDRPAAQLPAVKVPPLKLKSSASSAGPDENAGSNLAIAAGPAEPAAEAGDGKGQGGKGGKKGVPTLRFMPGKKVAKKQAVPPAGPQLALDVPLAGSGPSSALPRLPFDAANDDEMSGGRGLVAL